MSSDHTQHQSNDEQRRAQKLSVTRTHPPIQVPGYEIQRFLGSGAFGEVWVGVDQNTGRRVAIKFYTYRGGVDWSLLSREVEKLVFLSADRYIVQLLDVGWDSEPPYYVMDYIENGSLEELLTEHGPRDLRDAVELFSEVSVGLMHMHGKGVLHCDLKPANVLLDQDHKPRLADFGQSRLSHEQSPALGTLFYMAPEQADMEAIPDARWDVYALGALLYCMLTGHPPHRSDGAIGEIDMATDLADRLARYRNVIRAAPVASEHRKIPGVDRALADIIDRCLAVDPEERFPSVQSVLEALRARDELRVRRPLQILGVVGPLLLLFIMLGFGWFGYRKALSDSRTAVEQRAKKGNEFAAKHHSEEFARKIDTYINMVEQIARDPEFLSLFAQTLDEKEIQDLLHGLKNPNAEEEELNRLRQSFLAHPARLRLEKKISEFLNDNEYPEVASLITTDDHGTHVADAFNRVPASSPIGKNFAWRTYFHGGQRDLDRDQRPSCQIGQNQLYISPVWQSTATYTWKISITRPIARDGHILGIIAVTVEMGQFRDRGRDKPKDTDISQQESDPQWYAVLVGARVGEKVNTGVILQHPLLDRAIQESEDKILPQEFNDPKYHVPLLAGQQVKLNEEGMYSDPLSAAPGGQRYAGNWIVGTAPVPLNDNKVHGVEVVNQTGLIVLVQEKVEGAFEPIQTLGENLLWNGALAMCVYFLVVFALWFFVFRMLSEPHRTVRQKTHIRSDPTPLHSVETLAAPPDQEN